MDGVQAGTVFLQEIKTKIWELELLEILLVHVQQDASKIKGGWTTADKLIRILWSDVLLICLNHPYKFFVLWRGKTLGQ